MWSSRFSAFIIAFVACTVALVFAFVVNVKNKVRVAPSTFASSSAAFSSPSSQDATRGRWVLVLDLDETLVHTPYDAATGKLGVTIDRPHVREFLREVKAMFDEVVVFTASLSEYSSPLFDLLEAGIEGGVFGRRLYREDCTFVRYEDGREAVVKDLRLLGEDLSRVRLVDNTPSTFAFQPSCGVHISSFFGDPTDNDLLRVLGELKELRGAGKGD